MGKQGQQSKRGIGEIYTEVKNAQVNCILTRTGRDGLDEVARSLRLSRSELLEQIGRGILKVVYTAPRRSRSKS
jgi:hypothetical protein